MDYSLQASKNLIDKTIIALNANGISAVLAGSPAEAREKVLSLLPKNAEVINQTSITLEQLGIPEEINDSGNYNSIRNQLNKLNRKTDSLKMQKLGAAPEWTIGSVHAVTENGEVLIASNTGSQLPSYAYGASHVIWVVGTQKIVKDIADGMKRIQEYIVPKESVRARAAYHLPDFNTNVSKLLIVNKEINPQRIHLIFVNQILGY